METAFSTSAMADEQNRQISEAIEKDGQRLRNFIRRRVTDPNEAEDILHEVFYELIEAYRLMQPIEQAGAWMFRVARNRIIDLFRKKKPQSLSETVRSSSNEEDQRVLEDLLPSPDAGPDAEYARSILVDELEDALGELSEDQRTVFLAHEIEGKSFKQISAETGVSVNTLLSRKHYAVLNLRRRLQSMYDEFRKG
jgi:RNA polymerase sigma factor (sigma-70 family)